MAVADGIYLVPDAPKGTYVEGTLLDAGWPAAALLIARRGVAAAPSRASASSWRACA